MKVLGIIGARSGSKSIPDKNIKNLLGRPLFAWIADATKQSRFSPRIIMSTDSTHYARLANKHGIETPFLRPAHLAGDSVPDFDYLHHACIWMKENENWRADIILRLPPTSPLCETSQIDACIDLLINNPTADSSRTVTVASKHPYKLWRTDGEYLKPFLTEEYTKLKDAHNMPRQSFPQAFSHTDVIALRWNTLVNKKSMAGEKILYHKIPKDKAIDIDTKTDFLLAEILLKEKLNS